MSVALECLDSIASAYYDWLIQHAVLHITAIHAVQQLSPGVAARYRLHDRTDILRRLQNLHETRETPCHENHSERRESIA